MCIIIYIKYYNQNLTASVFIFLLHFMSISVHQSCYFCEDLISTDFTNYFTSNHKFNCENAICLSVDENLKS